MTHKPKKLTPKQVQFLFAYRETGNATEAYRRVYNTTNMAPKTINREATRLLDHPLINARLAELEAEDRIRCAVTVDFLTEKLWEDRELARRNEHPQAAINATMAVAKLQGLVDGDRTPAAEGPNLTVVLGQIDEDELMRRYAETILLRQQRRERLTHAGNGRSNGGYLRP